MSVYGLQDSVRKSFEKTTEQNVKTDCKLIDEAEPKIQNVMSEGIKERERESSAEMNEH